MRQPRRSAADGAVSWQPRVDAALTEVVRTALQSHGLRRLRAQAAVSADSKQTQTRRRLSWARLREDVEADRAVQRGAGRNAVHPNQRASRRLLIRSGHRSSVRARGTAGSSEGAETASCLTLEEGREGRRASDEASTRARAGAPRFKIRASRTMRQARPARIGRRRGVKHVPIRCLRGTTVLTLRIAAAVTVHHRC
jgi:hypothetical protein